MGSTFISAETAPRFDIHGAKVIAYASPSRGSATLANWRVSMEKGASSPLHSLDSDEIFVCLQGAADFVINGNTTRVSVDDAIVVAASTPFRFSVVGEHAFVAIATVRAGCKASVEGGEAFDPPWAL